MTKKKNTVKCIQKNIIKHHNHEFTAAQIKEQKQFGIALKQNKAQIIFSGSFKDGLSDLSQGNWYRSLELTKTGFHKFSDLIEYGIYKLPQPIKLMVTEDIDYIRSMLIWN